MNGVSLILSFSSSLTGKQKLTSYGSALAMSVRTYKLETGGATCSDRYNATVSRVILIFRSTAKGPGRVRSGRYLYLIRYCHDGLQIVTTPKARERVERGSSVTALPKSRAWSGLWTSSRSTEPASRQVGLWETGFVFFVILTR